MRVYAWSGKKIRQRGRTAVVVRSGGARRPFGAAGFARRRRGGLALAPLATSGFERRLDFSGWWPHHNGREALGGRLPRGNDVPPGHVDLPDADDTSRTLVVLLHGQSAGGGGCPRNPGRAAPHTFPCSQRLLLPPRHPAAERWSGQSPVTPAGSPRQALSLSPGTGGPGDPAEFELSRRSAALGRAGVSAAAWPCRRSCGRRPASRRGPGQPGGLLRLTLSVSPGPPPRAPHLALLIDPPAAEPSHPRPPRLRDRTGASPHQETLKISAVLQPERSRPGVRSPHPGAGSTSHVRSKPLEPIAA
jgi:hypothetical protein